MPRSLGAPLLWKAALLSCCIAPFTRGGVCQRIALPHLKTAAPFTAAVGAAAGGTGLVRPAEAAAAADDGQLLCLVGASALGASRQDTTTGCVRLDVLAASRKVDVALPDGCSSVVLDALCNASDASCARLRSDGTYAAKRVDDGCLRSTCSEVCYDCNNSTSCAAFCQHCDDVGLLAGQDQQRLFFGGGFFTSLYASSLSLLCTLTPWCELCIINRHASPPFPGSLPPPPSPPPLRPPPPRPPNPPGTSYPPPPPSLPPPPGGKCGLTAPQSCLGIPCAGASTCTQTTPQCCCGADCAQFGDCCGDRTQCCLSREEEDVSGSRARDGDAICGTPPPGQSCQHIPCSGTSTCNLHASATDGFKSGCCCDALCTLFADCCSDRADCCGSDLSEPRRGQRAPPRRDETAAYVTERITEGGINVVRGVNVHTGASLFDAAAGEPAQRIPHEAAGAAARDAGGAWRTAHSDGIAPAAGAPGPAVEPDETE